MTDPWDVAARRVEDENARRRSDEETARQSRLAAEAIEREAAERAHQEMQAAIRDAVPALTNFLAERGEAAQRLLAACSDEAHVMFGCRTGGGGYHSVFLHSTGLRQEDGRTSYYRSVPRENRPATPQDAVLAFAREGRGKGNPDRVRNIVHWLVEQIDGYVPQPRG